MTCGLNGVSTITLKLFRAKHLITQQADTATDLPSWRPDLISVFLLRSRIRRGLSGKCCSRENGLLNNRKATLHSGSNEQLPGALNACRNCSRTEATLMSCSKGLVVGMVAIWLLGATGSAAAIFIPAMIAASLPKK